MANNGKAVGQPADVAGQEQVAVGWTRMGNGAYQVTVTFSDPLGQRTHLLDGAAAALVGAELQRLGKFVAAGLEPPPAGT